MSADHAPPLAEAVTAGTPVAPRGAAAWIWPGLLTVALVGAINWPYLLAYQTPASGPYVFAGILFNPVDGHSYLAKMREGWRGEWLFTLPYTAEPGLGALLFTYYLFLGHVARWTGLGIELTYHVARLVGGVIFLLSAYYFLGHFFWPPRERLTAWLFFALSSGLGWIAAAFGGFTSDLWVAEAIPFLSIFSNAHFALTWAGVLWILTWSLPWAATPALTWRRAALIALAVTLAVQTQPLALVNVGIVLGGFAAWAAASRRLRWADLFPLAVVGAAGLPWIVYDYVVTMTQPALAGWNAQNVTPAPPVWEALVSGGVPLALALVGLTVALRRRRPADMIPAIWLVLGALAIYAPFPLQRRLSLGIWTPIVILAGVGVRDALWPRVAPRWRPLLVGGLAALALPSNLLVYLATVGAARQPDPSQLLFLTRGEARALDWLEANAPEGALVLAAPATGLFIPARTDARVIYGHEFETVDAVAHKQQVEAFFSGRAPPQQFLEENHVDFIWFGPREQALGAIPDLGSAWRVVHDDAGVRVYGR